LFALFDSETPQLFKIERRPDQMAPFDRDALQGLIQIGFFRGFHAAVVDLCGDFMTSAASRGDQSF
jgi:hypothetical protein